MTLDKLVKKIDGKQLDLWQPEMALGVSSDVFESGIVVCYNRDDNTVVFTGAMNKEYNYYDDYAKIDFDKFGDFYDESELPNILMFIPDYPYNSIEVGYEDEESNSTWAYSTHINHKCFRIFKGNDLYCLGIVFYLKDLV